MFCSLAFRATLLPLLFLTCLVRVRAEPPEIWYGNRRIHPSGSPVGVVPLADESARLTPPKPSAPLAAQQPSPKPLALPQVAKAKPTTAWSDWQQRAEIWLCAVQYRLTQWQEQRERFSVPCPAPASTANSEVTATTKEPSTKERSYKDSTAAVASPIPVVGQKPSFLTMKVGERLIDADWDKQSCLIGMLLVAPLLGVILFLECSACPRRCYR